MRNLSRTLILVFILALVGSCDEATRVDRNTDYYGVGKGNGTPTTGSGNSVVPTDGSLDVTTEEVDPLVEIRHLVEPKIDDDDDGGTYTRKLTIPKNYSGLLYLAGINVNTLKDKNVKVRFRFGMTREPITVPATISQAAGLTPQTSVEVLVMDLRYRPFKNLSLIYDLFDYNDYTFHGLTTAGALDEPVQNNRDKNLFCRGLKLIDDPTFTGSVQAGCSSSSDVCKYAYAKVVDKGLVQDATVQFPITPTEPNIQSGAEGLYRDSHEVMLARCLPNKPVGASHTYQDETIYSDATSPSTVVFNGYGVTRTINGNQYKYNGPYRPINSANWQVQGDARFNQNYGIFRSSLSSLTDSVKLDSGYDSKLFPIYTKFNLSKDTEYLGSNNVEDLKIFNKMSANGESAWMDGCNMRTATVDDNTGENIGSCNVSALIEIIAVDDEGVEEVVATTKDVKLQLVKPQEITSSGEDVTLTSFQSCSSSNQCGSSECCFNKRCWDDKLVSQCVEDANSVGNLAPGAACMSDFECASLCCNQATGKCAVHDTLQDPQVFCSKPAGEFCIAKEWCMKHTVTECAIVKTGIDVRGTITCALRCYTHQEFGDCVNGICKPPTAPALPTFNPNDCSNAIDPPSWDPDTGIGVDSGGDSGGS